MANGNVGSAPRATRLWRDYLLVTPTLRSRHHHVCLVSEAFYRFAQQVVVSDRLSHCQDENAIAGPAPKGSLKHRRQVWIVTTLPWPANVLASVRLANATAAKLGWRWRWLLLGDDDCLISPSRDLSRALRSLRARVPWYLGTLDSMWSPLGRGPALSAAAVDGLGKPPSVVQPEDPLHIRLRGQRALRVMAVDAFRLP